MTAFLYSRDISEECDYKHSQDKEEYYPCNNSGENEYNKRLPEIYGVHFGNPLDKYQHVPDE